MQLSVVNYRLHIFVTFLEVEGSLFYNKLKDLLLCLMLFEYLLNIRNEIADSLFKILYFYLIFDIINNQLSL